MIRVQAHPEVEQDQVLEMNAGSAENTVTGQMNAEKVGGTWTETVASTDAEDQVIHVKD